MFNKKGMAVSGIIYSAVILFISILFGILLLLINRRSLFKSLYDSTVSMLENNYTEYRVIAKDGYCDQEGSGYDSVECGEFEYEYTLYSEKTTLTFDEFGLSKINNQGMLTSEFDLELTNATVKINEGIGSLIFDDTTTLISVNNSTEDYSITEEDDFGYNSIYIELILSSCSSDIIKFDDNNTLSLSGNSTICDTITLNDGTNTTVGINLDYTLNDTLKLMLIYNEDVETYDIIANGVKLDTSSAKYPQLNFREFTISNFTGKLNDLRFSSNIITEYEAINITNDNYELKYKLNKLNTELIYTVIEYK